MKSLLIALLLLLCLNSNAQKVQYTFAQAGDSTQNYYVTVLPRGEIKGVLIVLPGFGELPQQTLLDWDLQKFAPQAGLITIIPALGDWSFFYIDSLSHQKLNNFIDDVFKKYD